jgi:hypothetical protein
MDPEVIVKAKPEGDWNWIGSLIALTLAGPLLLSLGACTSTPKPMDVIWSADQVDNNGIARNPVWRQQSVTGQPPDTCSFCPCDNHDGPSWTASPTCTNAALETNSSWLCFGHWNWFPVEYEGTVNWAGHSNSVYDDDDYYFYIKRNDQALQTSDSRDGLELEFDSEETVDYWDNTNTWWDDFHHNYVDNNDSAAHGRIDGKSAIIVGLHGLDGQHGVHTELHPVYAMFVHVQDDAAQDKWAFFVRNWGDEGYCASQQEYADFPGRRLKVLIPHPGATGFSETDNVWVYGDNQDDFDQQGWNYQNTKDGLLLTFGLQDPDKQDGFVGDITINWTGKAEVAAALPVPSQVTHPSPSAAATLGEPEKESKELDPGLRAKFEKLDPAAQKLLAQRLKGMDRHPPARPKRGVLSTDPAAQHPEPTGVGPTKGSLMRQAPDSRGEARRTRRRDAALAFLKAHGVD